MKKDTYEVIVKVKLKYSFKCKSREEAKDKVENVELPKQYVADSFELVSIKKG
jgi:hypothetical protein